MILTIIVRVMSLMEKLNLNEVKSYHKNYFMTFADTPLIDLFPHIFNSSEKIKNT